MSVKEDIRWLETNMLLQAIISVAEAVVSQKFDGKRLTDMLKQYKGLMFPELAISSKQKAQEVEALMRDEIKKGPLKVQSLQYRKPKKKKAR